MEKGESLSHLLFNLLMNKIIKDLTLLNVGYRINNKRISMICYADDAALITKTTDDLQV